MAENGEVTVVGAGARLEGNVVSAGSLRIDGQVKGQINADGDVVLSPQSQVEADIRSQNVSVAGRFKGNIVVKGKAHLARGGRVDGNITSKTLVVEEGGVFHGQSIMDATAASGSSGRRRRSGARPRRSRRNPTRSRCEARCSTSSRSGRTRTRSGPGSRGGTSARSSTSSSPPTSAGARSPSASRSSAPRRTAPRRRSASAPGDEKQRLIAEVATVSAELKELEPQLAEAEAHLNALLASTPNVPHPSAPDGFTDEDAVEVRRNHEAAPAFDFAPTGPRGARRPRSACSTSSARRARAARGSSTCSGDLVFVEFALVRSAMDILAEKGFVPGDPAGARARGGDVRHRFPADGRGEHLPDRRGRPVPRGHGGGAARGAAHGRDPGRGRAPAAVRGVLHLFPARGGHLRQGPRAGCSASISSTRWRCSRS